MGGYLYLVTCRRVCFLCFTIKTEYLPLLRADAIRKFGLRREDIAALPSMKSVPGYYSPREIKWRARFTLIDHDAAREAGIAAHGSIGSMVQHAYEMKAKRLQQYEARKALWGTDGPNLHRPRSNDFFDGYSSNPKRFLGIIRAPLLNPRTGSPECVFHCIACRPHHYLRPLHWRRVFTRESFEDHIRECGEIIHGQHSRYVN